MTIPVIGPFYVIFNAKLEKWVGKKDPTYAVATSTHQPDAHWWADTSMKARTWNSVDGVRRFRNLCEKDFIDDFTVMGTNGSSVPLGKV